MKCNKCGRTEFEPVHTTLVTIGYPGAHKFASESGVTITIGSISIADVQIEAVEN